MAFERPPAGAYADDSMARALRKSPIYTRAGDRGETSLFGGERVPKDHPRVAAYGALDELNSCLGVAMAFLRQRRVAAALREVQADLFQLGAELASPGSDRFRLPAERVEALERLIDAYDARLEPLKSFVLPGGAPAAALLHLARTLCRRAEREVVALSRREEVAPHVLAYLNRLSDLLFVLARYVNKAEGRRETPWRGR
jgi:cob(I)alamin adenosyltransferase